MRYIPILLLFLKCAALPAQEVFHLGDFTYPIIRDTTRFDFNEDTSISFDNMVKPLWKDEIFPEIDLNNQTSLSPLYFNGVLFVPNSFESAYDALTGEKLTFGSEEARSRFKTFGKDTLISFTGLPEFGTVVVNIMTGKIVAKSHWQPECKAPFFLDEAIWLNVRWSGKTSTLVATDISENRDLWAMPLEKFSMQKTTFINGLIFTADPRFLSAVEIKTGRVIWKIEMKVNYISSNNDELFVASPDGLFSINIGNMTKPNINWKLQSEDGVVDINYKDEILYIQRYNNLLAFDGKLKRISWKANFFFSFYPVDQLTVTDDFVITINTEEEKYNLIYDRRSGKLLTENISSPPFFSFSKAAFKNVVFAISDNGKSVFAFALSQ